jgi:nicotinate (nicotinamide) nucleotide adenylyltransferase
MVRLATRDNPKLGSIVLQQNQFNVQDTLPILKNRFHGADIYMLLGDDIFKRLNSWPNVEGLIKSVEFIIGHRELSGEDIKSTLAALEKTRGVKLHYRVIETTLPDISSSKIRLALKRHKTPSGVPRPVLDYIKKQGLYASAMTE